MLRARSRFDAERPTYETCARIVPANSRSTVAFHAHDRGFVKFGSCIDITSGNVRVEAPAGVSTLPLTTVTISESPQVSQPNPLSRGRTVVAPRSSVSVTEDGKKFAVVKDGVSLQQLVDGLNGLGIGPRDLISILQAIKAAGAIEADIEVM